jgi:Gpi18-like mannosyltransferase
VLFVVGLVIRLVLARYSSGLIFDVSLFREWTDRLMTRGPGGFYAPDYFADYAPGYLYVLLMMGHGWRALTGAAPSIAVLKLPAIGADLAVAAMAMLLAVRITPAEWARRMPIRAMAAAVILLNPALILVSAVWGQVDSVFTLLVLAAIYVIAGSRTLVHEAWGAALVAIAVATKPQAVLAIPALGIVLGHRYFAADTAHTSGVLSRCGRLVALALVAVGVLMAMFAPFGVGVPEIPTFYRTIGSVYQFTSLWAFNLWGLAGFYRPDIGPGAVMIGGVPAFYVGLAAFAAAIVLICVRCWQALSHRTNPHVVALFGIAAATCAAFVLLTRTHERYLYLALVALAPFVGDRPLRLPLIVLSVCFLLNIHFVYVYFAQHSADGHAWTVRVIYRALFGVSNDASQLKVLSAVASIVYLAVAVLTWRALERYRTAESETEVQV